MGDLEVTTDTQYYLLLTTYNKPGKKYKWDRKHDGVQGSFEVLSEQPGAASEVTGGHQNSSEWRASCWGSSSSSPPLPPAPSRWRETKAELELQDDLQQ